MRQTRALQLLAKSGGPLALHSLPGAVSIGSLASLAGRGLVRVEISITPVGRARANLAHQI